MTAFLLFFLSLNNEPSQAKTPGRSYFGCFKRQEFQFSARTAVFQRFIQSQAAAKRLRLPFYIVYKILDLLTLFEAKESAAVGLLQSDRHKTFILSSHCHIYSSIRAN